MIKYIKKAKITNNGEKPRSLGNQKNKDKFKLKTS